MAAALLGGNAPAVSGAVLRGGGTWGAALTETFATSHEDDQKRTEALAEDLEDKEVMELAKEKPWLISAVARLRSTMADTRRKVLVRLGLLQTMPPQPGSVEPHIVIDNGIDDSEVKAQQELCYAILGFASVLVWTGLVALVAQYYLNKKEHPAVSFDPRSEEALSSFRYGPFDCLSRMDISLWVFCCPAIRWADNVSTIGVLQSFWLAFAIMLGFEMVTSEAQDLVAWTALAVICAGFRHQLRLKFNMTRDGATFFQDLLLYCCCPCCAITQEARQVEEAMRSGHPAIVKPANQDEEAVEAAADQAGQPGPPS